MNKIVREQIYLRIFFSNVVQLRILDCCLRKHIRYNNIAFFYQIDFYSNFFIKPLSLSLSLLNHIVLSVFSLSRLNKSKNS